MCDFITTVTVLARANGVTLVRNRAGKDGFVVGNIDPIGSIIHIDPSTITVNTDPEWDSLQEQYDSKTT